MSPTFKKELAHADVPDHRWKLILMSRLPP